MSDNSKEDCDMLSPVPIEAVASVFPEVWTLVFDKLEPEELEWCYDTCSTFRILLRNRRATFLFPKVFQHFEHLLTGSDLLSCRQVCHTWKSTVVPTLQRDKLLSWASRSPDEHGRFARTKVYLLSRSLKSFYVFKSETTIVKFLSSSTGPSFIPGQLPTIVTKRLVLKDVSLSIRQSLQFWRKAVTLLKLVGDQLRHLVLRSTVLHWMTFYEEVLVHINPFLQNLVSFSISRIDDDEDHSDDDDDDHEEGRAGPINREEWDAERERFLSLVERLPLTPFPSSLTQISVRQFPAPFIKTVLAAVCSPDCRTFCIAPDRRDGTGYNISIIHDPRDKNPLVLEYKVNGTDGRENP